MDIRSRVSSVFPEQPIPDEFFSEESGRGDIQTELSTRFQSRSWAAIELADWTHSADVETIVHFLTPRAFFYYLPSILIASLEGPDYLDWGVRALLPHNQRRQPRGEWWSEFFSLFSEAQRQLVRDYLREAVGRSSEGSETWYLAELGLQTIWSAD